MPAPVAFLVICTEFFGGLGLIVGLLTRIAALGMRRRDDRGDLHRSLAERFLHELDGTQKGEGIRISSSGDCCGQRRCYCAGRARFRWIERCRSKRGVEIRSMRRVEILSLVSGCRAFSVRQVTAPATAPRCRSLVSQRLAGL